MATSKVSRLATTIRLTPAHHALLEAGGEVWTRTSAAQALHARVALCVLFAVFCGVMPVLGPSIPILSEIPWNNPLWRVSPWWSLGAIAVGWAVLHFVAAMPFWRAMALLGYGAAVGLGVLGVTHGIEGPGGDQVAAALLLLFGGVVVCNALTVRVLGRCEPIVLLMWSVLIGVALLGGLIAAYVKLGLLLSAWVWVVLFMASQFLAAYFVVMVDWWTFNHTDPQEITPAVIIIVAGRPDEVIGALVEHAPQLLAD